jgi:quinol monooxygenase YgiN
MSVLIIGKFPGDTAVFHKALSDRAGELARTAEEARGAGCIHHRFGVGDGFVIIVDEWESPQQFEQFITQPHMQALIGEMGASGPPELTICEATASPDEY